MRWYYAVQGSTLCCTLCNTAVFVVAQSRLRTTRYGEHSGLSKLQKKMKSHKFTDYTYLEIKDLVDAGCLAIVPTGCTEQQGPHLSVDFDTWFAEAVALEAAQYAARCHDRSELG